MSQYVLMLSVGPVQGFIAAARRSRDLWSGSWLLSEISKACAKHLREQQATLIFPSVEDDQDLNPDSPFSVGNKIQVVINAAQIEHVRTLAESAKQAAKNRFANIANAVKDELPAGSVREDIWQEQVGDYVEVQAAWAQFDDAPDSYKQACNAVASLLAARKATRDFNQLCLSANDTSHMIPKSSLDGARETVLLKDKKLSLSLHRKLGLSDSEQLDCAGMVKRLGGKVDQFTPISRVAADGWLRAFSKEDLEVLNQAYEPLVSLDLATRVKEYDIANKATVHFPFDGTLLYQSRLEEAIRKSDSDEEKKVLRSLEAVLKAKFWKEQGQPCTYSVLLLADGDKMGELLDQAHSQADHQKITKALSQFAGAVPAKMREFHGQAIYSGGDDVLGLVPLDKAYNCAKALSQLFNDNLKSIAGNLKASTPTLSVGLAITHVLTPLGHVRNLANQAEKIAKGDTFSKPRNALGITLSVRSGSTTDLRLRWDDEIGHQAFLNWIKKYQNNDVTSRIAYDTREVFKRTDFQTKGKVSDDDKKLMQDIRQAEFKRMLSKARTVDGAALSQNLKVELEKRLEVLQKDSSSDGLNQLATELIIARWFAAKVQKDLGEV